MSDNQQHIIKKQQINVHFRGSQTDALAIQDSLSDILKSTRVEATIAKVFSEFSNENEYLILEKIEISLGTFMVENIEQPSFLENLQDTLRKQISELIPEAVLKGKQIYKPIQVFDFEQFIFFLEHGNFEQTPVKLISENSNSSFQDWIKTIIEQLNFTQIQLLKTLLSHNLLAKQRFINQVSNENFGLIIKKILAENTNLNLLIEENLWHLNKQLLLNKILFNNNSTQTNDLQEKQINNEERKISEEKDSSIKEVIFIQNAGVVLLHPFIEMFYQALGWTEKGVFNDNITLQKAVLMWHYLATGSQNVAEYALVLPKILCGMTPQTPLEEIEPLTDIEWQEAEVMLQAIIGLWATLKNTSPDGLRAEFLQREGKLDPHSIGGLTLTVEKKASDILLGSLPWGVSMVKFDWMKEILYIDWS